MTGRERPTKKGPAKEPARQTDRKERVEDRIRVEIQSRKEESGATHVHPKPHACSASCLFLSLRRSYLCFPALPIWDLFSSSRCGHLGRFGLAAVRSRAVRSLAAEEKGDRNRKEKGTWSRGSSRRLLHALGATVNHDAARRRKKQVRRKGRKAK